MAVFLEAIGDTALLKSCLRNFDDILLAYQFKKCAVI